MKVLLINPPVRDFYNTPMRRQPLGLLYLAASLLRAGHRVDLLDCGADRKAWHLPVPDRMRSMVPNSDADDSSPFKLFGRWSHYGPRFPEIEARIRKAEPDAIGIASLFSAYAQEAIACAERSRRAAPDASIIMGGGHASFAPGLLLRQGHADFCIVGEGETVLPGLLDALEQGRDPSNIAGVHGLRQDGSLFENHVAQASHLAPQPAPPPTPQLDALPLPARELLDLDAYRFQGRRFTQILSSRGCPFRCAFCSAHLTSGRTFRPRDPDKVVEEMLDCHDRFGITAFDFEDDNLVVDTERAERLMQRIAEVFGEEKLWLDAMNGISTKGLNPGLLNLMKRAGFRSLNISPLSGAPGRRTAMCRPERLDEVASLPEQAGALGFKVTAYLMIGYPGQPLTEIMDDLHFWAEKPVLLAPSVFYPAPGSPVQRERFPYLDDADAAQWALTRSSLFPETPGGLSRKELRTAFWMVRMANFACALVPDRKISRLRELCALDPDVGEGHTPVSAEEKTAPRQAGRTLWLRTPHALDADARGKAALSVYLETMIPHGIQRCRRGNSEREWEYRLFPLEEMIADPDFYRKHLIPGFREKRPGV